MFGCCDNNNYNNYKAIFDIFLILVNYFIVKVNNITYSQ